MDDKESSDIRDLQQLVDELCNKIVALEKRLPEPNVTIVRQESVNADSITIGSPTNGQFKVYGDSRKPADFKTAVDVMCGVLREAKAQYPGNGDK